VVSGVGSTWVPGAVGPSTSGGRTVTTSPRPVTGSGCWTRVYRLCGNSERRGGQRWTESIITSTEPSAAQGRYRMAAFRCGSLAAANGRRSGSRPSTSPMQTSMRLPKSSSTSRTYWQSTARTSAPTSGRSSDQRTSTSLSARQIRTSPRNWHGCETTSLPTFQPNKLSAA
jgi:hypothetical protein